MLDKEKIVAMTEQEFIKLKTIVMYACYLCGDNIIIYRTEEDTKKIFSGIVDACSGVPISAVNTIKHLKGLN